MLDPSDGRTFWSANEFIGDDGYTNIWRTHLTSFTAPVPASTDDCKKDGWKSFGFKNQGQCIRFVNTAK